MRVVFLAVLLVAPLLSGCFDGGPEAPGPGMVPADTAPLTDWLHDVSQAVAGLPTVTEHLRTGAPGPLGEPGIELDTWIIRPDVAAKVPIVLEVTPYYTGGAPTSLGRVGAELIDRGYAVGVSSVRGTGNSGGCFTQGGAQEAKDTAAVVEHVAGQDWSTGKVGIMGVSYPGTTPQDVWVEAPPSLKTIVPISGISDLYKYNFVNAVPIDIQGLAFNTYYWALEGPATFDPTDVPTVPGAIAGEVCPDQTDVQQGGASSTVDGNKDAYWQERDFLAEYRTDGRDVERPSVFFIHGLQDWNVKPHQMEDWLDALWDSGVPMKVWLGQWHHAWPSPSGAGIECTPEQNTNGPFGGACRADWWNQTVVAWFDQFLKGIDTGILDAPRVQVQDDDGRWRHEDRWPPQDADVLRFGLVDGALVPDADGSGDGAFLVAPSGIPPILPPGMADRVTFVSEPLVENLTISGLARFQGTLTPSGARASVVWSLGEQRPDGSIRYVDYAALSLNHAGGLATGVSSVAGQDVDVDVRFFPQDDVLHAGNRIVLTLAGDTVGSQPAPALVPTNDVGTVTVHAAGALLELPVDRTLAYEDPQPYATTAPETQNGAA